jgi:hypothetical protein
MKTLIFIGGFYCLAFFVFHVFFWKLFDWKQELRKVSFINRGVMQILNLRIMWVFLVVAYVSFFHAEELLTSALGKTILAGVALFALMRAVEQIVFFGLKSAVSVAFFIVFLLGAGIYSYPLVF